MREKLYELKTIITNLKVIISKTNKIIMNPNSNNTNTENFFSNNIVIYLDKCSLKKPFVNFYNESKIFN